MIKKIVKKYNIDVSKSFMIGDRFSDILAGKKSGCKTIFIDRNYFEIRPKMIESGCIKDFKLFQIV